MLHTVKLLHFIGKYKKQKGTSNFLLRGQFCHGNEISEKYHEFILYSFFEKGDKKLVFHPSNHFITETTFPPLSCN